MSHKDNKDINILVVDDEAGLRDLLSYELGLQGFKVMTATDGVDAISKIKGQKFDLVISDIKMPKMDGLAALEEIKKINPNIEVIMATGFGTIETAVTAMKRGAYDFIQKPFNLDEIYALIDKALEKNELKTLIGLYESSKAIFSTMKLDELLQIVMDLLQKVLKADEGSLMLLSKENKLCVVASLGLGKDIAEQTHLMIGERIAGWAAEKRKELLLIDGLACYAEFSGIEHNPRLGSSIVIPLIHQNELLGVMNLSRLVNHDNFTTFDLHSASIFASQVSQAVQNAKLYQSLEIKVDELKVAYDMLDDTKNKLVESEKLASIGKLVAGVAHEINNPLTSVLGYSDLLIQSDIKSEAKEQLVVVYNEAQRCRKIVQDLLIFARRRSPEYETVRMEILIDETLSILAPEIAKSNVTIEKKYQEGLPTTQADPDQLKQVFLNILANALQALDDVKHPKKIEVLISKASDTALHIVLTDNGSGITEENIHKIFDPFFSTKDVGKGTGLGLSLSYGIVREHGGEISVASSKGKGASFVIQLPIRNVHSNGVKKAETAEITRPGRSSHVSGKKVLLVEDEIAIQNFMTRILSQQGWIVETVSDGESAFARIKSEKQIDLVICDYRLPKMNGIKVYEEIRKVNNLMADRFIFVTGSTADRELDVFFEENHLIRLMKPFTIDQLFSAIDKKINSTEQP